MFLSVKCIIFYSPNVGNVQNYELLCRCPPSTLTQSSTLADLTLWQWTTTTLQSLTRPSGKLWEPRYLNMCECECRIEFYKCCISESQVVFEIPFLRYKYIYHVWSTGPPVVPFIVKREHSGNQTCSAVSTFWFWLGTSHVLSSCLPLCN